MTRLYADENFPLPVVEALRQFGHDVVTAYESGNAEQKIPDETVLTFAATNNRVLLTLNRKHFIRLHLERPDHKGVVVCTFDPDFVGQASRIDAAIKAQLNLSGQLIRVNRPMT